MEHDPVSQQAVVRAMTEPGWYPHRPVTVEHVQTHISHVFLAGPYVYKLKKAVRFPFLDFGTAERRAHFCREEVRLNRRLSTPVYLDVVPITQAADGRLVLGGSGDAVEHVVRMRRLPQDRMLVQLLADHAVTPEMLQDLARLLAAFHAKAPSGPEIAAHAAPEVLQAAWEENVQTLAPFVRRVLDPAEHEILADFGPSFIRSHETLLRGRLERQHVREGHGDLHAEHVCFVDAAAAARAGEPALPAGIYVFDCIEFSLPFRCTDVASEIAFLAMDLEYRERPDLAAAFVDAYVEAAGDPTIAALLPFYASFRACVRAKVECLTSADREIDGAERAAAAARARRYLALAIRMAWRVGGPAVIACMGLSGSGKSTLAQALADATGFALLRSDVIRKRAGDAARGVAERPAAPAHYGQGRYSATARSATYEALAAEADAALAAGHGVIVDATYIRRTDRRKLAAAARRQRRRCIFVECHADPSVIRARLDERHAGCLSDARWDTYIAQRQEQEPLAANEPGLAIETTSGTPDTARIEALRRLWSWRQGRPFASA